MIVSGFSRNVATARSQVSVGMDLLTGSTVMIPTVICGTCTVVGKCNICETMASVLDTFDALMRCTETALVACF
ncbi:hypothetical protein F2Q69_00015332 [Brassica cretica]|uniref:Uncharacterized protein n=1 Tax=Brassica cretica TaxID=69181 RepID=A0A8S9R0V1_BRACR|nr:hypothetical protein F2Q69_00015332 [Brassica cretica]